MATLKMEIAAVAAVGVAMVCGIAAAGDAPAATARAQSLPVRYTLKTAGFVSAAVYDAQGRMVRPLLYREKQEPGEHSLSWDGLDRYGQAQPPGEYEWRLLRTPGFKREFLVNLGTNITWAPVDYWPGNHGGPSIVMVDDNDEVWVGSSSSEGPPTLIRMTMDGRKLLFTTGTWGGCQEVMKLARIGDVWYVLINDATLWVRTAKPLGGAPEFWYVYCMPKLRKFVDPQRIPYADLLHQGDDRARKKISPMSMAGGKGFLVITYQDYDEVRLLYPKDDVIEKTLSVKVPRPASAVVSPDGLVYVASDPNRIVRIDPGTSVVTSVVTDPELKEPVSGCLTYDPVYNDLIVANGNHLRRYNVDGGKLISVYGRPQGRTYGVFDPLDFDGILDVAADGKGGFFTVEAFPRRVAHFSGREKHQLIQQWFGGMPWEWQAILDPADPTVTYMGIDSKHLARGKIDYAQKTWTVTHLYDLPERFFWGANAADWNSRGDEERSKDMFPGWGVGWRTRHVNGSTFLVNCNGGIAVVRVDEKENRLVPVARLGCMHPTHARRFPPDWWVAALENIGTDASSTEGRGTDNPKAFEAAGGYKHFCYSWSDANRNGRIDSEEIKLGSLGSKFTDGYCSVDASWNAYWPGFGAERSLTSPLWMTIPNEGKDEDLPVWNWDRMVPGKALDETEARIVPPQPTSAFGAADGEMYIPSRTYVEGDWAPLAWPNNASTASRFFKWNRQGLQEFSVGVHTTVNDVIAGGFADIRGIVGQVKGNIVVRDACTPADVWTPDGLHVGSLIHFSEMKPVRDIGLQRRELDIFGQPAPGLSNDYQEGQVCEAATGEVLWGCNDSQNTVVYRVTGWDNWERQKGKLSLPALAASARWEGKGLRAEIFPNLDLAGVPVLRRVDPHIWFGIMRGNFRHTPAKNGFFKEGEAPAGLDPHAFSARWTGFVEPPVSEDFSFVVFAYGDGGPTYHPPHHKGTGGSRVRLWIDGKLVIDSWDGVQPGRTKVDWWITQNLTSGPISLTAGKRVPIKLEFSAAGDDLAHLHLYWESRNWDMRHIPGVLLYPD